MNWTFGENDTVVPTGLKAFGTSQDDSGTLRVYPANILSPSGTRFQCREIGNGQILNVTLELRKPITLEHQNDYLNSLKSQSSDIIVSQFSQTLILEWFYSSTICYCSFSVEESLFFMNLNLQNITDFSSLYTSCHSQVPDIPYAKVSVVNQTNSMSGRDYFYCRVETERGIFRSSSVLFQRQFNIIVHGQQFSPLHSAININDLQKYNIIIFITTGYPS